METAQLILSIVTPVLLLALGIPIARYTKRLDTQAALDEKLIERRLALFERLGPDLNDLYCLTQFVGHFRSIDPPSALKRKRRLDKTIHVNRPIFSTEVMLAYTRFIDAVFKTPDQAGENAKLLIEPDVLAVERGGEWPEEWDDYFADEPATPQHEVERAYTKLVDALARDFGGRPDRNRQAAGGRFMNHSVNSEQRPSPSKRSL